MLEFQGFCDSSNAAYAAAVYVRDMTSVGVVVDLLSAKSKVPPLKAVTLPRLELLACLLLSKLVVLVRKAVVRLRDCVVLDQGIEERVEVKG